MKVSLYNLWYMIVQRPHHLATTLLDNGLEVEVHTTRRMRSMAPTLLSNPEVHSKTLISSRLYNIPITGSLVRKYNEYTEESVIKNFVSSQADLFIYQRSPNLFSSYVVDNVKGPLIYDCIDDCAGFSGSSQLVNYWEEKLCDRADYIWVVSRHLQNKLIKWKSKVRYAPNGVNYHHFSQTTLLKQKDVNRKSQRILIYVGAIYDWFDVKLVNEVAHILTDWEIVLIGPVILSSQQMKYIDQKNIRILGSRDYSELPAFLATADVAMIPFVINDLILGTSPIKLYEYLAAGLPVVATPMPEVLSYCERGVVSCAKSSEEFAAAVIDLSETSNVKRCQEIARNCSWGARFLPLLEEIRAEQHL